jgi:prepilin-type N-terminal cleavage/methylation domain-containing protein
LADDHGMTVLRRDEAGFTLIELAVALMVIALLVVISVPLYTGYRNRAVDLEAKAEVREALIPVKAYILDGDGTAATIQDGAKQFSPTLVFDPAGVNGVAIQEATDGSVCLWRAASTENVFGIWQGSIDTQTLYAVVPAIPADCPLIADTAVAGFVATPW